MRKYEKQTNKRLALSEDKEGKIAYYNNRNYPQYINQVNKVHLPLPPCQVYQKNQDSVSYCSNAHGKTNILGRNHLFSFNKGNAISTEKCAKIIPSSGFAIASDILSGLTKTVEITPAVNHAAPIVIKKLASSLRWSAVTKLIKFILALNGERMSIGGLGFWKKVLTAQERSDLYNNGYGNTLVKLNST